MKPIIIFIFLLTLGTRLFCQELPCATEVSSEYYESMKETLPEFESFKTKYIEDMLSGSRSFASKKNSIPIRVHIVRQTTGITTLDTSLVRKGIAYMNKKFAGAGLEFYVCGAYNYINNTTYYTVDETEFEPMNTTYGTANIINLYMVNGISFGGASAVGVAPTPGGSLWVILRNNADTNTYAHEMGHFFGLLHTHGVSNSTLTNEFVDGSNSAEAGDYFSDTPADPRLSPAITVGANVNASCIYIGNLKDGHYQTFTPDATNIMSYGPSRCLSHFSNEQLAYMNWVYINRRSNLTCSSLNVNFNSSSMVSCDSPYVYHFINESSGVTTYRWDVNDDDINDYTTTNPTHTYPTSGVKWVSLSAVSGGKTYMRYKPIEFIIPHKVPHENNLNTGSLLPGWKFVNTDDARSWDFVQVMGSEGLLTTALRFRNFNYLGYEPKDEIITNAYNLKNFKNARLSFDVAYAPHNAMDTLMIYISTDCGSTYNTLLAKLSGAALQTHAKQFQEFIPTENDWKNIMISLNTYVNNNVRFRIVNVNNGGNNLYIDNIRVDGGDSTLNEIGFGKIVWNTKESSSSGISACRGYKIISIPVFISTAPTSAVTANVLSTGTATAPYDYELLTTSVTFPIGSTNFQYVNVKIWDDAAAESIENLELSLSIVGASIYRTTTKNRKVTITINDNDPIAAEQKTFSKVLLYERFEGLPTDSIPYWTMDGDWISTSANGAWFWDGYLLTRNNSLDSTDYMVFWSGGGSHPARNALMVTPTLNVLSYDSLTIELDQWYKVYLPYSGNIVVEIWNGTAWVNKYTYNAMSGNLGLPFLPNHIVVPVTGITNPDFKVRMGIVNDLGSFWYLVDNVKITGYNTKPRVSTKLNASSNVYIGPNELVHIYDDSTGNILASIQNLSSWDYGCTNVSIDRSGDSVIALFTTDSTYFATQKTWIITPTFNNPTGLYDITLYYKDAEINNWLSTTHNNIYDLSLFKTGGAISNLSPYTPTANGPTNFYATDLSQTGFLTSDYKIKGRFSQGFSGFTAVKMYTGTLPFKLLSPLSAKNELQRGNVIQWTTIHEINCDYFELQRSSDGLKFSKIGQLDGAGNSNELHTYMYIDDQFNVGKNYYRFKQVDYDKDFTYSNIALVENYSNDLLQINIYPNPCVKSFSIKLNQDKQTTYVLVDMHGKSIKLGKVDASMVDVCDLNAGVYLLQILDENGIKLAQTKLVKL